MSALDDYIKRRYGSDGVTGVAEEPRGEGETGGSGPGSSPSSSSDFNSELDAYLGSSGSSSDSAPADEGAHPSESTSPALRAWRTLTSPLKAAAGLGAAVGGGLASLVAPEAYKRAAEERKRGVLHGEADRPLSVVEQAEALPGLGDVAVEGLDIPKEGWAGRLRPIAALAGDIGGDPLTYLGGYGLATKAGRAYRTLEEAQLAVKAAVVAGAAPEVVEAGAKAARMLPSLVGDAAELSGAEGPLGRAVRKVGGAVDSLSGSAVEAGKELFTRPSMASALKFGVRTAIGPGAGIAFAPDIVEGVGQGIQQTWEDARAGRLKEAAASGVGTMITSALGALVAKGLIHETQAAGVLERSLAEQVLKEKPGTGSAPTPGAGAGAGEGAGEEPPATLPRRLDDVVAAQGEGAGSSTTTGPVPTSLEEVYARRRRGEQPFPMQALSDMGGEGEDVPITPVEVPIEAPPAPAPEVPPTTVEVPPTTAQPDRAPNVAHQPHRGVRDKPTEISALLEEHAASGEPLTKAKLVERGFLTKGAAANLSVEKIIGSDLFARLEKLGEGVSGGGYRVRPSPENKLPDSTPTPSAISPAQAPEEKSLPKPVRERLEDPERAQQARAVLDHLAESLGKPLHELTKAEIKEAFPNLASADREELYVLWGRHAREVREAAQVRAEAEGPTLEERLKASLEARPDTTPAGEPQSVALTTEEAPPPVVAGEGGVEPADRTTLEQRFASEKAAQPPYGSPLPRDIATGPRTALPNPAPTRGGEDRPGIAPVVDQRAPGFEDLPSLENRTRLAGEQATAPTVGTEKAARSRVIPPEEVVPTAAQAAKAPGPLDTPTVRKAAARLVGETETGGYDPASPAGQVQASLQRRGYDEGPLQDTITDWLGNLDKDPARHLEGNTERGRKKYEFETNLRRLLLDEPDTPATREEIAKLLTTSQKNRAASLEKNARARTQLLGGPEGELTHARESAAASSAAEGLDPTDTARLAIRTPDVGAPPDTRPEFPRRPENLTPEQWKEQVKGDPKLQAQIADALKWAYGETHYKVTKRSGTKGVAAPHIEDLRAIASDLGLEIKANPSAKYLVRKVWNDFADLTGRDRAQVTEFLTNTEVAKRGYAWQQRIDAAPKIPGHDNARVVDFEGDAPNLVRPLQDIGTQISDPISRAISDLSAATDLGGRYGGLTPSPQLHGVRIGDDIYTNVLEAYHQAGGNLDGTARATLNNLLHELVHAKATHDAASGDRTYIQAYARALEDAGQVYHEALSNLTSALEPVMPKLEAAYPSYTRAQEVLRARLARNDAGTSGRVARPIPDRRGEGTPSSPGRVIPGVQPDRDVPGRGGEAAQGGRAGAAGGEGVAGRATEAVAGAREGARGGSQEGLDTSPHGAGPDGRGEGGRAAGGGGVEEPQAHLTSLIPDAIRNKRTEASLQKVQAAYALAASRYSGDGGETADEIMKSMGAIRQLPEEIRKQLREAGPGEHFDIGMRMSKFADSLSPEQREQIAMVQLLSQHDKTRNTPVTQAMVDSDVRDLFDAKTPEEALAKMKASGVRTVRDLAAVRTLVATFGEKVDQARSALIKAAKKGDDLAISQAQDRLAHAALTRDGAISVLNPASTEIARMLAFHRTMAHPLSAEETFRSRFFGAMRAARIPEEKAKGLYSLLQDTLDSEQKHGPGTGDWTRFGLAFREATKAKAFDKFLEFWKAGLLGWPTQIANIGSNAMFFGLRNVENGLASIADSAISGVTGAPRQRYIGETGARMHGLRIALGEAFHELGADVGDIIRLQPPNLARRLERGSFYDEPNLRQLYGAIEGKKGEFIRIPFKLLDAADNFFKHLLRMQEYGAQAHRIAQDPRVRAEMGGQTVGRATSQIFQELRQLASDPISNSRLYKKPGYKAAIEAGRKVMLEDTFQKPLGENMRKVYQATQTHPALQLLFPFMKTPYNILGEGVKRTALGAAWAVKKYAAGEIDRPEFVSDMVKGAVGTAVMATVASMALDGKVTGSGPADPKQQEELKRTGWQPFSIKIGGGEGGGPAQYLSYQRVEPFSTFMGLAADIADAWKNKDNDTANEMIDRLITTGSDNILDKSFMTGLSSLVKIVTNSGGSRATAVKQLQASLVPNIVGVLPVGHATRALDPHYRETEAGTLSPFLAQIPGASETLAPQYTPSGEPRMRKGTAFERLLSPIARSEEQTDPIAKASAELVRLGQSTEAPPLYIKVGDEKVYYTPEEREALGERQQLAMSRVAKIIQSPSYAHLPDKDTIETGTKRTTKGDVIHGVIESMVGPVRTRINQHALTRAKRAAREQA